MGLREFFGFGSSAGTATTTGSSGTGLTGSWPAYDEATAREHHRTAQAPVQPAATDRWGRRVPSVSPYTGPNAGDTRRNFGRPYREGN
ncbi:hypothetical protein [Kitasatospora sp. CB01950]|uniref:hypothetical protein n=1 Tax=Kitasatospora sp. CB01950 TaxID=1703930 RepID=UPI00093F5E8B|nr:hypothetical protein [Kitasatospora sp. CB01950]OKI95071.1 hypothetical protein AMK19_32895 [Kitasatospora sp. CB01950]